MSTCKVSSVLCLRYHKFVFNTRTTLLTCTSVAVRLTLSRSLQVYGLQFSLHHASTCPLKCSLSTTMFKPAIFSAVSVGYIFQDVWHIFLNDSRHHSKYRLYNKFFLQDLQQEYDTYCFLTYPDQMLSGYLPVGRYGYVHTLLTWT